MRALVIIAMMGLVACGDPHERAVETALREGNARYSAEQFDAADSAYANGPSDARLLHNRGNAEYRLGVVDSAITHFSKAGEMAGNADDQARATYNLGDGRLRQAHWADSLAHAMDGTIGGIRIEGDDIARKVNAFVLRDSLQRMRDRLDHLVDSALTESAEQFKNTLRRTPHDEDARHNLALAQRLIAARPKNTNGAGGKNEEDKKKELSERAKLIMKRADELVEQHKFQEALNVLEQGLKQDATLQKEKEYMDKLGTITKAASAT
ncbi:MAG: hypothetical protein ABI432_19770 [Flavobacteriales bacterium]